MKIPIIGHPSDRPILTVEQWQRARAYAEKHLAQAEADAEHVVVPMRIKTTPKILLSPNEPVPGEHVLISFPIKKHHESGERFLGEGEAQVSR